MWLTIQVGGPKIGLHFAPRAFLGELTFLVETLSQFGNHTAGSRVHICYQEQYQPAACLTGNPAERRGEQHLVVNMSDNSQSSRSGTLNRRELLKLSPLLALSALAIPRLRDPMLSAG